MHYSQIRSAVESSLQPGCGDNEVLRVHLQGFIDSGMLERRLAELTARVERDTPTGVLCDLRAVAGYDSAAPALVREWFMLVRRAGIARIALIATSSVLHTHAYMLARDLGIELRSFHGEAEAARWLSC